MRFGSVALATLTVLLAACSAAGLPTPASSSARSAAPASSAPAESRSAVPSSSAEDPLRRLTLRDVRTGTDVTIADLVATRPVLLETMAIWCTNCRGQQRQVVAAHDLADFASISLDVDPNERPGDLADYADREGFDWHFAVANAELARMLRDRFGAAVLNPPSMPKILFRTDGSVEMIGLGEQLSAADLAALVAS